MGLTAKIKDSLRKARIASIHNKAKRFPMFEIKGSVLIIAPHPDDEVLGCGGLISHLIAKGINTHIIILSGGGESHKGCCGLEESEIKAERAKLTASAASILGLKQDNILTLDFPDGGISMNHPQISNLKQAIDQINPDNVLIPHSGEGWPDHLAARGIGLKLAPSHTQIWEYCVWYWFYPSAKSEWKDARILNLTKNEHDLKCEAIDAYTLPKAPCGNPWSGVLPKVFVKACCWDKELYFKIANS